MGQLDPITDLLWQLHQQPDAPLLDQLQAFDLDLETGQQVQLSLLQRYLDEGATLGGWKIGMTSGASRNAMGDGIRPFGFVLQSRILTSHSELARSSLYKGGVENELCLILGDALGADATPERAKRAVAQIAPAFEINQKRLPPDAPPGLRVADNLSNWGIVVGEPTAVPDTLDEMTVALFANDAVVETVSSADHIDDHFASLAILARELAKYDQPLRAGHKIITGAYGKTPFAAGHFRGEFDQNVGTVDVRLLDT